MCSCIFRILFQMHGILCMIMHKVLYHNLEMCENDGVRGKSR